MELSLLILLLTTGALALWLIRCTVDANRMEKRLIEVEEAHRQLSQYVEHSMTEKNGKSNKKHQTQWH